jgi:heat shock protein HtpX
MTRYPPADLALEKLRDDTTVTTLLQLRPHLWIEQPMSGVGDEGKFGRLNRMFDTHPRSKSALHY